MNLRKGKDLKHNARFGEIDGELFHVGLRLFAVRALEVSKLDKFQILRGRAAIGTVGALLQLLAGAGIGTFAEGEDFVTGKDVLAVGESKK